MTRFKYSKEEIKEANDNIPDAWGWYILAMLGSEPWWGFKIHDIHAKKLEKIGVIGRVPTSGNSEEKHKNGPWYAITLLGQLVAEAAKLQLNKDPISISTIKRVSMIMPQRNDE